MRPRLFELLRCPRCRTRLRKLGSRQTGGVESSTLKCVSCETDYPIIAGIPRFAGTNYARSFGFQWNQFSQTQLDDYWGASISRERFEKETRWPLQMTGQLILEAGCGAGRFTGPAAMTGAEIVSLDYSNAIDANARNNDGRENVYFLQASIYDMPFEHATFDKIFCLGVLQHTPDPENAFLSLTPFLKPGGEIVIDVYRKSWKVLFQGKYYLRIITRLIPPERLLPLVDCWVRLVYPFTGFFHRILGQHACKLSTMLGMADYRGVLNLPPERSLELSILDTFDMLSPAYDSPQTLRTVQNWFERAGLEFVDIRSGFNGIEGRGARPKAPVASPSGAGK